MAVTRTRRKRKEDEIVVSPPANENRAATDDTSVQSDTTMQATNGDDGYGHQHASFPIFVVKLLRQKRNGDYANQTKENILRSL